MLSGPMMLLKSMGLDPEAITKTVQEYGNVVIKLKEQMDRIEANQILNTAKLDELMRRNPASHDNVE